jgi:hypothetical protein
MGAIPCPGCGSPIRTEGLLPGMRIDCELCAGVVLEVTDEGGRIGLREVPFASCPVCDARLEVPRQAKAGDEMSHCGRVFRLTYEFGAWALA